jgi:hypothetical protein
MSELVTVEKSEQLPQEAPASPADATREKRKASFLRSLRAGGGNVSQALRTSKLRRATAYEEFRSDPEFAESWLDASEASYDDLLKVARNRAKNGSDRLMIYILESHERGKKWRDRLVQAGTYAVTAVRETGMKEGLSEEQIVAVQRAIVERLDKISLV